jgi:hypothetical protein
MMNIKVDWMGEGVGQQLETDCWGRIVNATEAFLAELKQVLNVRNPPPFLQSSRPGEPPRKRTGWGQAHVIREYERPQLKSRVGVEENASYMAILELSKNRPWFMVTLQRMLPALSKIVTINK